MLLQRMVELAFYKMPSFALNCYLRFSLRFLGCVLFPPGRCHTDYSAASLVSMANLTEKLLYSRLMQ